MKLSKRNGIYYADLRDVGGGLVSLRLRVADDPRGIMAKQRLYEAYAKLQAAPAMEQGAGATLQQVFRRCMQETDWHSAKDQEGLGSRWRIVSSYFGPDCPIGSIDYDRLCKFVGDRRAQGVTDPTIHRDLSLLSPMLRQALLWGYISRDVPIPWTKGEANTRMHAYTMEQERQALDWLFSAGYESIAELIVFLADSGWRIGEALSDDWEVRGRSAVLFDQKGKERGVVKQTSTPLTPRALAAAQRRLWRNMNYKYVAKVWAQMRAALSWPDDANLHAWRHTCATRLARAGVQVKPLQAFMRHSSLNTTIKYIKLLDGDLAQCAEVLSSLCHSAHVTVESVTPVYQGGPQ